MEVENEEDRDEEGELGGLFHVSKKKDELSQVTKTTANGLDCSKFPVDYIQDSHLEEVRWGHILLCTVWFGLV